MNGGAAAKIRFVRCPKCRQLLVEPPDVPVYECGGCGTRLRAKIRKNIPEGTTSGLNETDAAEKTKLDCVSEAKESSSSNLADTLHSPGECDLALSGNCDLEHLRGTNLPKELQSNGSDPNDSEDFGGEHPGDEDSSNQKKENDKNDSGDSDNEHHGGDPNDSGDFDGEHPGDEEPSNNQKKESNKNNSGDSDYEHHGGVSSSNECQKNGSGQNESGEFCNQKLMGVSLSSDDQKKGSDPNDSGDFDCEHPGDEEPSNNQKKESNKNNSGDSDYEHHGGVSSSNECQKNGSGQNESGEFCNQKLMGVSLSSDDQKKGSDPNDSGDFDGEHPGDEEPSNNQKKESNKNNSGDSDYEHHGGVSSSNECLKNGSGQNESGEFCNQKLMGVSLSSDDQKKGNDPNDSGDFDGEHPGDEEPSNNQKKESNKNDLGDSDNEHHAGVSSSNECQKVGSGQNESGEFCNQKLMGVRLSSDDQERGSDSNKSLLCENQQLELPNDVQIQHIGSEVCSNEQLGHADLSTESQKECSDQNDCSACNTEHAGFSSKVYSPTKLVHLNKEKVFQLAGAKSEAEVAEGQIQQNDTGDFNNDQLGGVNSSMEAQSDGSDQNCSLDCNIEQAGISYKVCSPTKLSHFENEKPLSSLAGAESKVNGSDESSPLAVAKAESDSENESDVSSGDHSLTKLAFLKNKELPPLGGARSVAGARDERQLFGADAVLDVYKESDPDFIKASTEKPVVKESPSVGTGHRPAGESISSDIFVSFPNEQVERHSESAHNDFECIQGTDTFENADFNEPSSELIGTLIDLSKSPTTRSSRAYYGDGVSSYEGADDQIPDRHTIPFRNAYKPANRATSEERPRREKFAMNSNSEMQHRLINHSNFNHDEWVEHMRVTHAARNMRRLGDDQYPSQVPFYQRGSSADYDSTSPSNQFQNRYLSNPGFDLHEEPTYAEREKMKLWRMIFELQEQVNKACFLNGKANQRVTHGVTWKDQHIPSYYDHEALEQVIFDDLNYPRHPGRFAEGSNWPPKNKYSRIPFSAEVASSQNQVDHTSCCCPRDWRSAQLPPPIHHNKVFCEVHDHVNFHNSYGSCPPSPQWHVDSEFSIYGRGTHSDDARLRERRVKKSARDKHHSVKRHLRPVAGGAPFITCRCCFKQLQLPADFLVFERNCYRLRCSCCLEVLKFSLVSKTHLVPYATPTADTPPPSEVDELSDAPHKKNQASTSHASGCPNVDPVSCSEDYGFPFCKSCSTDGDPVYQRSLHAVDRNVSYNSMEHIGEQRNMVWNEPGDKCKNPVETWESSGPSSSISELKKGTLEMGGRGGPPLHRLMGYSSPGELVYGYGPSSSNSHCPAMD